VLPLYAACGGGVAVISKRPIDRSGRGAPSSASVSSAARRSPFPRPVTRLHVPTTLTARSAF